MSRDHYKGIPKKRPALLNSNGNFEALEKGGDLKRYKGSSTLSGGTVTVSGEQFVSGATAWVSGKHPYPADEGFNWFVGDGYLTISGSNAGTYTVAWEVTLP